MAESIARAQVKVPRKRGDAVDTSSGGRSDYSDEKALQTPHLNAKGQIPVQENGLQYPLNNTTDNLNGNVAAHRE
jgi:hypothetical protein